MKTMKIRKSDIETMTEIIMDYRNYLSEMDMQDDYCKAWKDKVDKLDDKLWDIINNKDLLLIEI